MILNTGAILTTPPSTQLFNWPFSATYTYKYVLLFTNVAKIYCYNFILYGATAPVVARVRGQLPHCPRASSAYE